MTRATNARLVGFTYLVYIALGVPAAILFGRATSGEGIAARLASIDQHAPHLRVTIMLLVLTSFAALVLAVALYGITRDEDRDIALLALTCRVGEGVLNAVPALAVLGLLWLGASPAAAAPPDAEAAQALGALLFKVRGWGTSLAAILFAVGSLLFSYLLLRGRMVPLGLAWLGVLASALLAVLLPLQVVGLFGGVLARLMWLPMLVFEVALALWLLARGVAAPVGSS